MISINYKNYFSQEYYFAIKYKSKNTIKEEEQNNLLNKRSLMINKPANTKFYSLFVLHDILEYLENSKNDNFSKNYIYIFIFCNYSW